MEPNINWVFTMGFPMDGVLTPIHSLRPLFVGILLLLLSLAIVVIWNDLAFWGGVVYLAHMNYKTWSRNVNYL
jgi:hypothetical protein